MDISEHRQQKEFTPAQRRMYHHVLHRHFDELLAAFLGAPENRGKLPSSTTIKELLEWSHAQTQDPEKKSK